MQSIENIAKLYAGRAKCNGCPIGMNKCVSEGYYDICFKSYIKGFVKGYRYYRKEIRNKYIKILKDVK